MTPDQINAAIAEFEGYVWSMPDEAYFKNGSFISKKIPNYYNDWYALTHAEAQLPVEMREEWAQMLLSHLSEEFCDCAGTADWICELMKLTTAQRAESLALTVMPQPTI